MNPNPNFPTIESEIGDEIGDSKNQKLETNNEQSNLGLEEKSCVEMENAKGNISSPLGSDTGSIDSILLTDSDDDSNRKDKESSSKVTRSEFWEQFFNGSGRKEYIQNFSKLPKIPLRHEKPSDAPELALEYFRTMKNGGDYEYVASVSNIPTTDDGFGSHINFFARPKGTDSSPEFFFAAFKNGSPQEVVECCIINPKPFLYGETPHPRFVVCHCEHVICDECDVWADFDGGDGSAVCV